jgi:CRISPR-associated protein Cas1
MDAQLRATAPLRKRLWQHVIQSKLSMQAATLALSAKPNAPLLALMRKVRVGDPSNIEGQGARAYWRLLMGETFRRDPEVEGVNGLLNYGYAVIRSMIARHLIAVGLHPGIPIHHSNEGNPMRLVDDMMEPFRPISDAWVRRLIDQGVTAVNSQAKQVLGKLHTRSLLTNDGVSTVSQAAQRLCVSLAKIYEGESQTLDLPHIQTDVLKALFDEQEDKSTESDV